MEYLDILYLGWIINFVSVIIYYTVMILCVVYRHQDITFVIKNTENIYNGKTRLYFYLIMPFASLFKMLYIFIIMFSNMNIMDKVKLLKRKIK